ncbi:MAG: Dam family site-specific DNA-(adenine-N6)-methyltransferase [Proteobacteria bacterium]|nr:Dam family site-specific DNA-(adenine-N6)-methyltransferase [Pseudomonadota bacterium]
MKALPHPIQYQGSKRNLAPVILRYFPKGINRLVEPFAGSAAISVAAAAKGLAKRFWVNDLNQPLAELLKLITEKPEELAAFYEQLWNQQHPDSIDHFYRVRDEFNQTQDPRLFLYLLARCVKGSVRYNSEGLLNQSPDKRRQGTRPATMRKNIMGVARLLQGKAEFTSLDYREVFKTVGQTDLIYMDPPYQGVCGNRDARYYSGISHEGFVDALEELAARKLLFIISYDGRRGDKTFGEFLPECLDMTRIELEAGRSSQSTLLGLHEVTFESLYLSRTLMERLDFKPINHPKRQYLPDRQSFEFPERHVSVPFGL